MEQFLWVVLGTSIGIGFHLLWRRQLLQEYRRLFRKLGVEVKVEDDESQRDRRVNRHIEQRRQEELEQSDLYRVLEDCETLQQWLPMGFIEVDRYNKMLKCNPSARQMFGLLSWEPNTKVLLEWVRSYELDRLILDTRNRAAASKTATKPILEPAGLEETLEMREWVFYPSEAERQAIPMRGWGVPLSNGHVGIFLENRSEETDLALERDRWASDVAHELKTPLTSIRLVAETLQSRVDDSQRKWVDRLHKEVLRLSDLVQDLLELSRLDLKSAKALHLTSFDLVETLNGAWRSLDPLAAETNQFLTFEGPNSLEFKGDRPRLHRLFLNLLDNALKYGPDGSAISVTFEVTEEWIHCQVRDHGSGFPPESLPMLFERFYRTDSARSRKAGGSGLGLAIAKQIVEVHGGQISAANISDTDPEDSGACISFSLQRELLSQTPTPAPATLP